MEFSDEISQIQQAGMESAAVIWETLEHLPQPINPVAVYKAVSSVKCAEFLARTRMHKLADALTKCVVGFLDATISIVGAEEGDVPEGLRAVAAIEKAMPLTDEIFDDPVAYATRQHVYEGILLLAAAKLGKEVETKKCIEDMRQGVANALIMYYLKSWTT